MYIDVLQAVKDGRGEQQQDLRALLTSPTSLRGIA